MTHFVGLVMCETEQEIASLVSDYCENDEVEPYFVPLECEDKDRMIKHYLQEGLPTDVILDDAYLSTVMIDWNGCEGAIVDGVLGHMTTYNPKSEWDWYVVGGRWNDDVPNNNCLSSEIANHFTDYIPAVIVTTDGWQAEKEYGWFGSSSPTNTPNVVADILSSNPDKRVWVVDFHI